MNSFLLNVIIQTIPKTPANEYQDSKLIIKSRNEWKKDRVKYFALTITAAIVFFLTDKLPVPFIGLFFFLFGIGGFFSGLFFCFRACMVYKHYFDIYRDEDIKKIEEK